MRYQDRIQETRRRLKLEVEEYLSSDERKQALTELMRHPQWHVVPDILRQLRKAIQTRINVCNPDQLTCLQGQMYALESIENALINTILAKSRTDRRGNTTQMRK